MKAHPEFGYEDRSGYTLLREESAPLRPVLQDEQGRLEAELDALFSGEDDLTDEAEFRITAIRGRLGESTTRRTTHGLKARISSPAPW